MRERGKRVLRLICLYPKLRPLGSMVKWTSLSLGDTTAADSILSSLAILTNERTGMLLSEVLSENAKHAFIFVRL